MNGNCADYVGCAGCIAVVIVTIACAGIFSIFPITYPIAAFVLLLGFLLALRVLAH